MPLLGQLLVSLLVSLSSFFASIVTKKLALGTAAIVAFGIITVSLVACLKLIIAFVGSPASVPSAVGMGFSLFMPANFPAAASSVVSAVICAAAYRWTVAKLNLLVKVT